MDQPTCFGSGSIVGAIIGTFVCTIVLGGVFLFIWNQRRKAKKNPLHGLVLVEDGDAKNFKGYDNVGFTQEDSSITTGGQESTQNSKNPIKLFGKVQPKDVPRHNGKEHTILVGNAKEPPASSSSTNNWNPFKNFSIYSKGHKSKGTTVDDSVFEEPVQYSVQLIGHDFTGLGFNVCGNMKEGIYIKDLMQRGPASESKKILPGDKIQSMKVSFSHMVLEDALTILSYASPYEVEFEMLRVPEKALLSKGIHLEQRPASPMSSSSSEGGMRSICHPFFKSQSIDDLRKVGQDYLNLKTMGTPTNGTMKSQSSMHMQQEVPTVVIVPRSITPTKPYVIPRTKAKSQMKSNPTENSVVVEAISPVMKMVYENETKIAANKSKQFNTKQPIVECEDVPDSVVRHMINITPEPPQPPENLNDTQLSPVEQEAAEELLDEVIQEAQAFVMNKEDEQGKPEKDLAKSVTPNKFAGIGIGRVLPDFHFHLGRKSSKEMPVESEETAAEKLKEKMDREAEKLAKEKQRLEKEAEKIKEKADKEAEKMKIKAEKEAEKEAERIKDRAEKEAEKLRLKAEKEAQAEKEAEKLKEKAKKEAEKMKLKAEKEAEKEAEKIKETIESMEGPVVVEAIVKSTSPPPESPPTSPTPDKSNQTTKPKSTFHIPTIGLKKLPIFGHTKGQYSLEHERESMGSTSSPSPVPPSMTPETQAKSTPPGVKVRKLNDLEMEHTGDSMEKVQAMEEKQEADMPNSTEKSSTPSKSIMSKGLQSLKDFKDRVTHRLSINDHELTSSNSSSSSSESSENDEKIGGDTEKRKQKQKKKKLKKVKGKDAKDLPLGKKAEGPNQPKPQTLTIQIDDQEEVLNLQMQEYKPQSPEPKSFEDLEKIVPVPAVENGVKESNSCSSSSDSENEKSPKKRSTKRKAPLPPVPAVASSPPKSPVNMVTTCVEVEPQPQAPEIVDEMSIIKPSVGNKVAASQKESEKRSASYGDLFNMQNQGRVGDSQPLDRAVSMDTVPPKGIIEQDEQRLNLPTIGPLEDLRAGDDYDTIIPHGNFKSKESNSSSSPSSSSSCETLKQDSQPQMESLVTISTTGTTILDPSEAKRVAEETVQEVLSNIPTEVPPATPPRPMHPEVSRSRSRSKTPDRSLGAKGSKIPISIRHSNDSGKNVMVMHVSDDSSPIKPVPIEKKSIPVLKRDSASTTAKPPKLLRDDSKTRLMQTVADANDIRVNPVSPSHGHGHRKDSTGSGTSSSSSSSNSSCSTPQSSPAVGPPTFPVPIETSVPRVPGPSTIEISAKELDAVMMSHSDFLAKKSTNSPPKDSSFDNWVYVDQVHGHHGHSDESPQSSSSQSHDEEEHLAERRNGGLSPTSFKTETEFETGEIKVISSPVELEGHGQPDPTIRPTSPPIYSTTMTLPQKTVTQIILGQEPTVVQIGANNDNNNINRNMTSVPVGLPNLEPIKK